MQFLPALDEPSTEAPPQLVPGANGSARRAPRISPFSVVAWLLFAGVAALAYDHFGEQARVMYRVSTTPAPTALMVPVQGVAPRSIADSWHAVRGGGRKHEGIDIFARRGTPVVSPVAGIVTHVGQDRLGGNIVRVLGPGRQVHYFAHLDRFAALSRWDVVEAGDVIGYVGNTGNARGGSPHLHYGIYGATGAINPFPFLKK
jgi:peptidoglycan LD-endopeptidase LytH